MRQSITRVSLLLALTWPASALGASDLTKKITDAKPASAEGSRRVIALFHAELLRPPEDVSTEARALCGRYLPTAIGGMKRGHVATCGLQADAYEAKATCAWLAGQSDAARKTLTTQLALLDCPTQGIDGVDRATRLASDWLWPEVMEAIVHKQRQSLVGRKDSARAQRAAERNLGLLGEARRRRHAARTALGKRPIRGLLILGANPGSPAARAGLRRDDVLTLAGSTPVKGVRQLRLLLQRTNPSPLTVYRRGKAVQLVWRGAFTGLDALPLPERLQSR